MTLLAGTRLGPYEILAPLGAGGMGEVYRAHDPRIQREVALKVLPEDLVMDVKRRQRFEREARAAGTLQHPNVLAVYDVGVDEGRPYLVSELLGGESLRATLRGGTLPVRKALDYTIQVARGLAAAHEKGVVHRDIKPENLFVTNEGRVCILDFGVAKLDAAAAIVAEHECDATPSWHTDPGTRLGTSAYMSPEQVCGEPVDARSDIFSLGCVLHELLTGRAPFLHATPFETLAAIVTHDPPSLRRHQLEVPIAVERIVLRCLEKRRGERFQSAHDLALALEAVAGLDAGPVAPDAPSSPKAPSAWWPWAWGAALVALGFLLGTIFWQGRPAGTDLAWASHQLTSDPGWEAEPALSPDGESVAYVSDRGGAPDLWLMRASGGEPIRLTDDATRERSPAWFPDGNSLAFVSDRDGHGAIYKIPALGGKPVLVVRDAEDPAISPDGARLAFVQRASLGQQRVAIMDLTDPSRVLVVTGADGSATDHRQPAWSPDGRSLCYADSRNLWLMPSAGGRGRQLTSQGIDRRPEWAADGQSIYFSSYRDGTQALWRILASGGVPRRVTFGTGPEGEPSLSRDGRRLAYSTFISNPDIVAMDQRSGRSWRFGGGLEESSPAIAPDRSRIVFTSERDGAFDLWQQAFEDGRPRGVPARLTDLPGIESTPAFSRDGRWLAYCRAIRDRRNIWVQPSSGGTPVRITDDPAGDIHPAWSPDGRQLAFISRRSGRSQVWRIPVAEGRASGPPSRVTGGTATDVFPTFLSDGSTIAFVRWGSGTPDVWLTATDGRQPARQLTKGADARFVRWDPAHGALLVSGSWGGSTVSLRAVTPGSAQVRIPDRAVVFGQATAVGDFDISSDGSLVAFVREETRGDVWLIEKKRP